jgi:predicted TPR repeat methyltransferase
MQDKTGLDAAYALKTPEDSRRLYRTWADSYDAGFAAVQDYRLPVLVAEAFQAGGGTGPVLDVGAGTGLCGARLAELGLGPVDGIDISPEMLAHAGTKGIYRALDVGDVTGRLAIADCTYRGVVSSGTFTLGHVGPAAIGELLRVAAPGALFVLSVHSAHFHAAGFAGFLAGLGDRIGPVERPEERIYGAAADVGHRDDIAYLLTFRRT